MFHSATILIFANKDIFFDIKMTRLLYSVFAFVALCLFFGCGNKSAEMVVPFDTVVTDSEKIAADSGMAHEDISLALEEKASFLSGENYIVVQYSTGKIIYVDKNMMADNNNVHVIMESVITGNKTIINAQCNTMPIGLFEGESGDVVCLFSENTNGACFLSRINLKNCKQESFIQLSESNISNLVRSNDGFQATSSYVDPNEDNLPATYYLALDFKGTITTKTER